MWIMTKDGWKQLSPKAYAKPIHVPTMLERMGIDGKYDGVKGMADYANGPRRGVYFTYKANGVNFQSKGAKHPLVGMYAEESED
jgi:hypothetical protein